jgi:iron complex transport system ATP-binding protein
MDASLQLKSVSFIRDGCWILKDINFRVQPNERWLVLGANGSGKTSLLRIAALHEHPSSGSVTVLGESLGTTDVRTLRCRIGYMSASLASSLRENLTSKEVVMTAKYAALEPWWHTYDNEDRKRALECLKRMSVGDVAERTFGTLSSGEQQRVLLARTLMTDPGIILLDEPSARLDLGGREFLVQALAELTTDTSAPPLVIVSHHVDEIPPGMTHILYLSRGTTMASGTIGEVLTSAMLSECFGLNLHLEKRANGRFSAWAV